jgi:hypothetical protein
MYALVADLESVVLESHFWRPLMSRRIDRQPEKIEKRVALLGVGAYVDRSWRKMHELRPSLLSRGSNRGSNGSRFPREPRTIADANSLVTPDMDVTLDERVSERGGDGPPTSSR